MKIGGILDCPCFSSLLFSATADPVTSSSSMSSLSSGAMAANWFSLAKFCGSGVLGRSGGVFALLFLGFTMENSGAGGKALAASLKLAVCFL